MVGNAVAAAAAAAGDHGKVVFYSIHRYDYNPSDERLLIAFPRNRRATASSRRSLDDRGLDTTGSTRSTDVIKRERNAVNASTRSCGEIREMEAKVRLQEAEMH